MLLRFGGGAEAVSDNAALIGALVALGGVFTTQMVNSALEAQRAEQARNTEQAQREHDLEVGSQRAQDDALQAYLDQITQLIREGLRDEDPLSPLRLLARARTLSVFWQLGPVRKRVLLQMLHEAVLIKNEKHPIIWLSGADLRGAYLRELNLKEAKMDGADLKGADLSGACLRGANLGGADLRVYDETGKAADLTGADLSNAHLTHAKVTKVQLCSSRSLAGATMPDDKKYEEWIKEKEGCGEDEQNSAPT